MRLKLDENLGRGALGIIAHCDHDVATVASEGLCSARDEELIEICQREGRCLITLDLDFGNPLHFRPSEYPGIAVLRLPRKPSRDDLLEAMQTLLAGLAASSIDGKLWIVKRGESESTTSSGPAGRVEAGGANQHRPRK